MMPYQFYQLYQAERTKTAAEIRRTDEQQGELSRALSSAWHHATRPIAVLRAPLGAVAVVGFRLARLAREYRSVRRPHRTQRLAPRRTDYLVDYHPCFQPGGPSAPSDRSGQDGA
jgi:hypothetical protein